MPEIDLPAPLAHLRSKLEADARHKLWDMGRRWHKTTGGIVAAIDGHGPRYNDEPKYIGALQGGNIWILDQNHPAATTLWYAVRGILRPIAKHVSEADRRVLLWNDGAVTIKSAANPDALVGDIRGLDGVVMNEGAKYKPEVWQKAISAAIAERKAWTIWPSTPEGINYFYDLYQSATREETKYQAAHQGLPDWKAWREPSTENPLFDPAEIEARRKEGMPENLIRQEFYAEFIQSGAGRTYHEFTREDHERADMGYDPSLPLDLCVSFGVAPAAWLVTQGREGREVALCEIVPASGETAIRVFANLLRQQFPKHGRGDNLRIFGEVAKGAAFSDFEAIRAEFPKARAMYYQQGVDERDRVNSVNATLRNQYGDVSGYVAPACERLIRDLEGTRNADASYRVDHRQATIGHYAAAWGCKLMRLYPAIARTARAVREESGRNAWGFPIATPEAKRAYSAVQRALANGTLKRPNNCEDCGVLCKPEAAHTIPGYLPENALKVRWLCKRCHAIFDMGPGRKGGTG